MFEKFVIFSFHVLQLVHRRNRQEEGPHQVAGGGVHSVGKSGDAVEVVSAGRQFVRLRGQQPHVHSGSGGAQHEEPGGAGEGVERVGGVAVHLREPGDHQRCAQEHPAARHQEQAGQV